MRKVNILVVVDAQVDFESGSLGTKEAQASVGNIADKIVKCGNEGYLIFATKDTHDENYLQTNEGKNLPVEHTIIGTDGWKIVPPIYAALSQYNHNIILKDTFGSADLAGVIRTQASKQLKKLITDGSELCITLIGWCTDICVISNAILLKTAFPEAEITVDSECCAGVTPEAHEAALTVMRSCQIKVVQGGEKS